MKKKKENHLKLLTHELIYIRVTQTSSDIVDQTGPNLSFEKHAGLETERVHA